MSKPKQRKWQDITDLLTDSGVEAMKSGKQIMIGDVELKAGNVLKFDFEGSPNNLRIVKLDRVRGKLWAREVHLRTSDDLERAGIDPTTLDLS